MTSRAIAITAKKTMAFEMRMDPRKDQLTACQFNSTSERKMSEGNAKVPTNVLRPFDSALVTMFKRPARYLFRTSRSNRKEVNDQQSDYFD